MNRMVLGGGMAACVVGILYVGFTGLPAIGNTERGEPSLRQLCERDLALTHLQNRVIDRIKIKTDLIRDYMGNSISFSQLMDSWVWLNEQSPYYPVAIESHYPKMTANQVAATQIMQALAEKVMTESASDEILEQGMRFQALEAEVKRELID